MGLELYCTNPECRWHNERKGGRFIHLKSGPYCEDCAKIQWSGSPCKNLWEMTTSHITGSPVKINSLAQLRQLEKTYGVSSHAANMDARNWERT